MEIVLAILGTQAGQAVAGVILAVLALLGFRMKSKADGRREAEAAHAQSTLEAERKADDVERKMAAEVARSPDADRTTDRLRKAEF